MRLMLTMIAFIVFLTLTSPVLGSVYIYTEKESINIGDTLKIQVATDAPIGSPFEILVEGGGEAYWLCKSDSGGNVTTACGRNEWLVTIPDDWEEGTYIVKVLINDVEPVEYFKEFEVVKPKILKVNLSQAVYQGIIRVEVGVKTANVTETSLSVRLRGNNIDFFEVKGAQPNETGENEYVYGVELNLREIYKQTRDISQAIQPSRYLLEMKLFYRGKIYDTRSLIVDVKKPEIDVDVSNKVLLGNPIIVRIKTNRTNDPGYDGIVVTLVGSNYVVAKRVYLDRRGNGAVQFETGSLAAGKYMLYIRDTCLTTATVSISELATKYYNLQPESEYSRVLQAEDDVLVNREIWLLSDNKTSPTIRLAVSPVISTVPLNSSAEFRIILTGPFEGINSYELTLSLDSDVAFFASLSLPDWASSIDRHATDRFIRIYAANFGGFQPDSENVNLATISLKPQKPGSAIIRFEDAKVFDGNGELLDLTVLNGNVEITEPVVTEPVVTPTEKSGEGQVAHASKIVETVKTTVTETATTIAVTPTDHESFDFRKTVIVFAAIVGLRVLGHLVKGRISGKKKVQKRKAPKRVKKSRTPS